MTTTDLRDAYRAQARDRGSARIVHLGLGAFHRAHQADFTARAAGDRWGIHAFTGGSTALPEQLAAQDGLFTLMVRGGESDEARIVDSIVRAQSGRDSAAVVDAVAAEQTALVTLTVTEKAYLMPAPADPPAQSTMTSLAAGLALRAARGGAPIALVSCDNVPHNGAALRTALERHARSTPGLLDWLAANATFVSTVVDRITPRTTAEDVAAVSAITGWRDPVPVVTEPFSEWILAGAFPSGRPDWRSAGARFVDDVEPWERRKLWLLNGAHTILASVGMLRGHSTIARAMADPVCRDVVESYWDDATPLLTGVDAASYRLALGTRFGNPRIAHRLAQIATDGLVKLRLRLVPVATARLSAGGGADGVARGIGAWIAAELGDAGSGELSVGLRIRPIRQVLEHIDPELAAHDHFAGAVEGAVAEFRTAAFPAAPEHAAPEHAERSPS